MRYENFDSFSKEELTEIVHDLEHELEYEKETVKSFHKENQILKDEFYKLNDSINNLTEIENILKSKYTPTEKIQNIEGVLSL